MGGGREPQAAARIDAVPYYLLRRSLYLLALLLALSMAAFAIIQLPPGDYLNSYVRMLAMRGATPDEAELAALKRQYGLDLPLHRQYLKWARRALHGDFGRSMDWEEPVSELIAERLLLTVIMNAGALIFIYAAAIPAGIFAATHQYSIGDHALTVASLAGLATPQFLLALVLMVYMVRNFGASVGGLFSPEYVDAAWSVGRVIDLLKHLPVPVMIIGLSGTGALSRVMRSGVLDELKKQYVVTARAKGAAERGLLFKYPVRVAINPIISTVGWMLPATISGGTITAIVLSLPTLGPLLIRALRNQDMFLAGTIVMLLGFLTVVGTFVSDLLLMWTDPRIRYERSA